VISVEAEGIRGLREKEGGVGVEGWGEGGGEMKIQKIKKKGCKTQIQRQGT